MTTLSDLARDAGMSQAEAAADPRLIAAVDDVIARFAASGMPFSANDLRDDLPVVAGPLVGARLRSAAMRRPREIRKVGMTRSTLLSTHSAWIAVWVGVA